MSNNRPWEKRWDRKVREGRNSIKGFRVKNRFSVNGYGGIAFETARNPDSALGPSEDYNPTIFNILGQAANTIASRVGYVGKTVVSSIYSRVPVPVRKLAVPAITTGLVAACVGGSVIPTVVPRKTDTPQNIEATITATENQFPACAGKLPITAGNIYRIIFPFKEPSNSLEEFVYNYTDVVTYMKFVRAKEDVNWTISLANIANLNISQLPSFIEKTIKSGDLSPIVPLEDFLIFQQSRENYQGTRVEAEEVICQRGPNNELIGIPNKDPDIDEQKNEEFNLEFLAEKGEYPLEWTMRGGPNNSGYVDVNINLPLEIEWEVKRRNAILTPPVILEDRLYVADRGSAPHNHKLLALSTENGYPVLSVPISFVVDSGTPAVNEDTVIISGFTQGFTDANSYLYALDSNSGEEVWGQRMFNPLAPIIDGNTLYNVDLLHQLQSRNIDDGIINWEFKPGVILSSPRVTDDAVYVIGITRGTRNFEVFSLSKDGDLNWKADAKPNLDEKDSVSVGDRVPFFVDNFLVWDNVVNKGGLGGPSHYCIEAFDITTREVVFDYCISEYPDRITSVVSDGRDIYVSHGEMIKFDEYYLRDPGNISRFTRDNGGIRELAPLVLDSRVWDLVLTNKYIFAATDAGVTAIDRKNPDVRHKIYDFEYENRIEGAYMAISGRNLYVVVNPRGPDHILKFSSPVAMK